jgi:hypothetical protein
LGVSVEQRQTLFGAEPVAEARRLLPRDLNDGLVAAVEGVSGEGAGGGEGKDAARDTLTSWKPITGYMTANSYVPSR